MSRKTLKKKWKHGGWRPNSGKKPRIGGTERICVSVNKQTWQTAVRLWKKKPSWMVDGLLSYYEKTGGSILKQWRLQYEHNS
jgi:hypothetical protein